MAEKTFKERVEEMDINDMKRALLYLASYLDDGETPSVFAYTSLFERVRS